MACYIASNIQAMKISRNRKNLSNQKHTLSVQLRGKPDPNPS